MPTLIRTLKRITAPPNESSTTKSLEVVQLPQTRNNLTDLVHRDSQLKKNEATSSDPSDNTTSSQKAFTANANDISNGISAAANSYESYVRQSDRKQKSSSADSDEELPRKRDSNHAKATPNECTNWGINRGATLSSSRSRQCINEANTDEGLCHGHPVHGNKIDRGEKKRAFPSGDSIFGKEIKKRNRHCHQKSFVIDLSDVPPQQPIPKSKGRTTNNASKYAGVSFRNRTNKWIAQIMIEGKPFCIGSYDNEEEAAVDYARAVFKYKGGARQQSFFVDLKDVPTQLPIPKSASRIKEGASKYTGVTFNKKMNKKWQAQITIEGKQTSIGTYENEEEAAHDYARAVFKCKGQEALEKAMQQNSFIIDLSDVPPKPPIPKSRGRIKEGASKYAGVSFRKVVNKWQAQIMIKKKQYRIGYYANEEEAAVDYARALFKIKGQMPVAQPANDGLTLRSTANVWGKKPAAPTPMAPATNSFAATTNSFANSNSINSPTSSGGYGGSSSYGGYGASQPAPAPVAPQKTAVQIQKERMAAALFGGISAIQPPAPPPPSASIPVIATPQGQRGAHG